MLLTAAASAPTLKVGAVPAVPSAPRVVFLNPGESTERGSGRQWQLVSRFMAAAAKTFAMDLEVQYAERDHLLMLRQAEALACRAAPPHYVVLVNEKAMAPRLLHVLHGLQSKLLVIHNDVTEGQRLEIGNERERIANWIGTLTADASSAGYRLMEYLTERQPNGRPQVVGITGDPSTPVSMERAFGVQQWLARTPAARMSQLVYSDWTFGDSYEKTRILLKRYPGTNVIWAANDAMTLGAKSARDVAGSAAVVGGMGALPEALQDVMRGGVSAMMAGDYFIGAFAMVLLHDYHKGHDFAACGNPRVQLDFLMLVNRGNASSYYDLLFAGQGDPDFSIFSRAGCTTRADYDFSIERLLSNMSKSSDVPS